MDEKIKSSIGNGYNIGFNPTSPYSLGGTIQTSIPSVANEVNNFSAKIDEMDLSFTGDLEVIEDTTLDWVSLAKDCLEQLRTANNEEIEKLQNENGNGLLMRILPFVYYLKFSNFSEEEKTILINQASALTNAHEISQLGCKIYADYVTLLLEGVDKVKALDALKEIDYNKYYSNDSIKVYQRILKEDLKSLDIEQIRSSGYVVDSLEASLWCTVKNDTYEDAVVAAINLGEDTDTIGAITGSLNGIIYGKNNIPERWLNKLRKKDYLEELSNQFISTINYEKRSKGL